MTAATATPVATDIQAIQALLLGIHQAHQARDAAAIAAPYAPDAVVCDLAPPLAHQGVDPRQKAAWLETWDGPIAREPHDFQVTVSGDMAVCQGYFHMAGTPKTAGRAIAFWLRGTVILRRGDDGWRITHEHTSVPFYMDGSLRPAFDLKP